MPSTGAPVADPWETRNIAIEGMTCNYCVKTLTKAIKKVNGIKDVEVDRQNAHATVTFDTTKADIAGIHESIECSGYKATREIPK